MVDPRVLSSFEGGTTSYTVSLAEASWWRDDIRLDVVLGYSVRGILHVEDSPRVLFVIDARFLVDYLLREEDVASVDDLDDILADFVAANSQINTFPYLRQLVADQSTRAGWPALHMNVLRAPAKRPRDLVRNVAPWPVPADDEHSASATVSD
jgi:hypothetical protein